MDSRQKVKNLFCARIKSIRETKGLTQEQLAERVEMNTVYLSNIERGKGNPTLNMLIRISVALEVDMSEFFDFNHEVNSKQLKEMLKKIINDVDNEVNLKTEVRVLRAITR